MGMDLTVRGLYKGNPAIEVTSNFRLFCRLQLNSLFGFEDIAGQRSTSMVAGVSDGMPDNAAIVVGEWLVGNPRRSYIHIPIALYLTTQS